MMSGFDWARTGLGPRDAWPQSLKTGVELLLSLPIPALLIWGKDDALLPNDAYVEWRALPVDALLGASASGRLRRELDLDADALQRAKSGESRTSTQTTNNRSQPKPTTITISYAPIRTEGGAVGGVLLTAIVPPARGNDLESLFDRGVAAYVQNVEDRRRLRDQLSISERRFHTLADLLPDLIWTSDPQGEGLWCNRRWTEYTGRSIDAGSGKNGYQLIHPDDRQQSQVRFEEANRLGIPLRGEHRLRNKDGEYRWFLVRAEAVFDGHGQVVQWVGAATDVQDMRAALDAERAARAQGDALRQRAEVARAEAESERERLVRVLAQAPFAVYIMTGPEHVLTSINDRARRIIGYREPVGMRMRDAFPEPEAENVHTALAEVYRTGKAMSVREQMVGWDRVGSGTVEQGLFDIHYQPLRDHTDAVEGVLVFVMDVTASVQVRHALSQARDQAETARANAEAARERLRSILAAVPAAIALVRGPDHVMDLVNPAYLRVAGREVVLGRTAVENFPEFEGSAIQVVVERVYRTGVSEFVPETLFVYQRPDRAEPYQGYYSIFFAPLREADGSISGVVTATLEVTEQVRQREWVESVRRDAEKARSEIELAHAQLEEHIAARTAELAATNGALAAEIEERSRVEATRTALLRRLASAREDEQRRAARDLHDQVGQTLTALMLAIQSAGHDDLPSPKSAARLVDVQRLTEQLSREVHGLAVRLRPTALDDFGLQAALRQLLIDWSARCGVEIDFEAARLGGDRLPADVETVLYRVIQEALTNVARHARAQRVSVVLERLDGHAIAVIEDDGVGFELESLASGRLGLVGMEERVTLAGGTLDIESSLGRGTTVIARVPTCPQDPAGVPAEPELQALRRS